MRLFKKITILFLFFVLIFDRVTIYAKSTEEEIENVEITHYPFVEFVCDMECEEEGDRCVYTENTLKCLREYFKSLLILPREFLSDDYTGPEISYTDGIYEDEDGNPHSDNTLYSDPAKSYLCDQHKGLDISKKVINENIICARVKGLSLEVDDETIEDVECINPKTPAQNVQAVKSKDGKYFLFPLEIPSMPKMFSQVVTTYMFGSKTFYNDFHTGIDFIYPKNTPILASNYGVVSLSHKFPVTAQNPSGGYGNYVIINHEFADGSRYQTLYAHMTRRAVEKDDLVVPGQVIGYMGSTGLSTTDHLHYETRKCREFTENGSCRGFENNIFVDPKPLVTFEIEELGLSGTVGASCESSGQYQNSESRPSSLKELFKKTADAVGGVPWEAIYAIAKQETRFNCAPTWDAWAKGNFTECTGDPLQIAFASPNKTAINRYPCVSETKLNKYDPPKENLKMKTLEDSSKCYEVHRPVDVRGLTQFAAGEVPQSYANTFNGIVQNPEMDSCLKALGIFGKKMKGSMVDELSTEQDKYSRHIVGHSICATAVKLKKNAGDISKEDWTYDTLKNVSARYHGNCSLGYCDSTKEYFDEAKNL